LCVCVCVCVCVQAVNSDVSAGKSALDDVIIAGAELKKHSSDADNSTRLDNELSATKQRYEALVTSCSDRLTRLEEAVPLAETFHSMHEQVLSWLEHVEPELQTGNEPTGADAEKQLEVTTTVHSSHLICRVNVNDSCQMYSLCLIKMLLCFSYCLTHFFTSQRCN